MEEGKIDSSNSEDLNEFLEVVQEEIAVRNVALYKKLFWNCNSPDTMIHLDLLLIHPNIPPLLPCLINFHQCFEAITLILYI